TTGIYIGTFKQRQTGIQINRGNIGKVGGGPDGQYVIFMVVVIFHSEYGQVRYNFVFQPALFVDHIGIFANGHPVDQGNIGHSQKAPVLGLHARAVHIMSVRIGPVQDNHWNIVFRTSLHDQLHGGDISVETYPHILYVEQYNINILQLFFGRFTVFSIEGYYGESRFRVLSIAYLLPGIGLATKPVFRSKYLLYIDLSGQTGIYNMGVGQGSGILKDNTGLIGYDSNPFPLK